MAKIVETEQTLTIKTSVVPAVFSYTVSNSDESFSQVITDDTELSDIIVGDSLTSPSNVNVAVDTWDKLVSVAGGIGYNYPLFSGQEQIYRTWDDKYVEDNVFTAAVRLANGLKPRNWLAAGSFDTLINNNAFGNTLRFTDSVGGQNADGTGGSIEDYAIDHLTGIGYYLISVHTSRDWDGKIDFGPTLSIGGLTEFFLLPLNIYRTIASYDSTITVLNYWPFNKNGAPTASVLSTTRKNLSTFSYHADNMTNGLIISLVKTTSTSVYLYCRKHY
jgi:hypothetical protein